MSDTWIDPDCTEPGCNGTHRWTNSETGIGRVVIHTIVDDALYDGLIDAEESE